MQRAGMSGWAFAGLALATGCASARPLPVVRAADPATFAKLRAGDPFVMEFEEGENIPLSFAVHGQLLETVPGAANMTLVAKRHFFLRVDRGHFDASLDGVHYDAKKTAPGQFFIGFVFAPSGTVARIDITTPTADYAKH
jgi:hypothetical protein